MVDLLRLIADLGAEHAELDALVADLDKAGLSTPTPAEPWTVGDQISHLAFFDEQAALAAATPDVFLAQLGAVTDADAFMNGPLERGRGMTPEELLAWWRGARSDMLEGFRSLEQGARIPWFGPPMSPASFVSARLMETWAHGQDVADALHAERPVTDRLRHIAHLGVRARPFSYSAHGMEMPEGDIEVRLEGPGGDVWSWGDESPDRVEGSALDFCLVVTQRRHVADTDLEVTGPRAEEWIGIAQAFAGPPGAGRRPGQFVR